MSTTQFQSFFLKHYMLLITVGGFIATAAYQRATYDDAIRMLTVKVTSLEDRVKSIDTDGSKYAQMLNWKVESHSTAINEIKADVKQIQHDVQLQNSTLVLLSQNVQFISDWVKEQQRIQQHAALKDGSIR
jgi:hypothetical protein